MASERNNERRPTGRPLHRTAVPSSLQGNIARPTLDEGNFSPVKADRRWKLDAWYRHSYADEIPQAKLYLEQAKEVEAKNHAMIKKTMREQKALKEKFIRNFPSGNHKRRVGRQNLMSPFTMRPSTTDLRTNFLATTSLPLLVGFILAPYVMLIHIR
jgi:hypothetical protein